MTRMGIPRLVVKKILNHVESDITAVYDRHSYDQEKREALDTWGIKLEEIISFDADNVVPFRKEGWVNMPSKEPNHHVTSLLSSNLNAVKFSFSEKDTLKILNHLGRDSDAEAAKNFLFSAETEPGIFSQLISSPTQSGRKQSRN